MINKDYIPYTYRMDYPGGYYYLGGKYKAGCNPDNTKEYEGTRELDNEKAILHRSLMGTGVKTILKEFPNDREAALLHEVEIHKELDLSDPFCLNASKQTSTGFSRAGLPATKGFTGKKQSDHAKEVASTVLTSYNQSEQGRLKSKEVRNDPLKDKLRYDRSKEGMSKYANSERGVEARKLAIAGVTKVVQCPYCNKQGGQSNMKRYHFDNCRSILNAS